MIALGPNTPTDNARPLDSPLGVKIEQVQVLSTIPEWEHQIRDAKLCLRTRPGLIVDEASRQSVFAEITVPVAMTRPHVAPVQVDNRIWAEITAGMWGNMRAMTPEERAEYDALNRVHVRPLAKPLKRLSSF